MADSRLRGESKNRMRAYEAKLSMCRTKQLWRPQAHSADVVGWMMTNILINNGRLPDPATPHRFPSQPLYCLSPHFHPT